MIIWLSLVLFLLILKIFMGNLREKRKQKNFLIISGTMIALIMGLRYPDYEVVYDLRLYYDFYNQIINTTSWTEIFLISRFEPGYVILNKLLATIVPWAQFILIFEAVFCVYCVSRFIYKNSEYPFQAILFYICLGTMGFQLTAFRQAFAMSICLLSVEFIKEKKIFRFLLTVLLAMSFHKTALVFFPFYFIANRKPNWKNNLANIIAMVICISFAQIFTNIGNEVFDMQYGDYIGNQLGGLIPILIYILTIIPSSIFANESKNNIAFNMTGIGLTIYLMRYITLALERISFFYAPSIIIQLPNAINSEKNKGTKAIFNFLSIVLAIALFIYRLADADYADYIFFWQ